MRKLIWLVEPMQIEILKQLLSFQGFYNNCSEIEDYIDPDGKMHFEDIKEHFKDWVKGVKMEKKP